MVVKLSSGERFFPDYEGWYLTDRMKFIEEWEKGVSEPKEDYLLSAQKYLRAQIKTVPQGYTWYVWRKTPVYKENEFGTECP